MSSIINCEWALTSITKSSIHGPLILGRRFHMEERNPMEGKARIVGLDLSKKTFVGCNLTGERFEKRSFFNGRMDDVSDHENQPKGSSGIITK